MGIYEELGMQPIINAAGTYTVLGGSRMSPETLTAMQQAAEDFIPIRDLQEAVHKRIAELTKNEAAYVSNGAATGLYLAVAACIERLLKKRYYYLTEGEIKKANIVMFKAHRNPYDLVIGHLGAEYRELSFPNIIFLPTKEDLENAIDENTAAFYYAESAWVAPGYLPLVDVLEVCDARNVPVIVDAAAQLPPVENLWRFSEMGAAITLFSGGKDLKGPQASGLVVGKKEVIDRMTGIGFPNYGIGRMMKVGREELVGLYSAIKQYVGMDHTARYDWCEEQIEKLRSALEKHPLLSVVRTYPNEAGQPIARAFVEIKDDQISGETLRMFLLENTVPIYAYTEGLHGVFINPMSLREGETETIIDRLLAFGA